MSPKLQHEIEEFTQNCLHITRQRDMSCNKLLPICVVQIACSEVLFQPPLARQVLHTVKKTTKTRGFVPQASNINKRDVTAPVPSLRSWNHKVQVKSHEVIHKVFPYLLLVCLTTNYWQLIILINR